MTHDEVAVQQACDLPRGRAVHRLGEGDDRLARIAARPPGGSRASASGSGGGPRRRARPARCSRRTADPDPPGGELARAGPATTVFVAASVAEHVERLAAAHAQASALADGEVVVAGVRAEPATAPVHDVARPLLEAGVPAQELALALAGEEAEVLALRAARRPRGRRAAAISRTSGLVSSPSGKRSRASDPGRSPESM